MSLSSQFPSGSLALWNFWDALCSWNDVSKCKYVSVRCTINPKQGDVHKHAFGQSTHSSCKNQGIKLLSFSKVVAWKGFFYSLRVQTNLIHCHTAILETKDSNRVLNGDVSKFCAMTKGDLEFWVHSSHKQPCHGNRVHFKCEESNHSYSEWAVLTGESHLDETKARLVLANFLSGRKMISKSELILPQIEPVDPNESISNTKNQTWTVLYWTGTDPFLVPLSRQHDMFRRDSNSGSFFLLKQARAYPEQKSEYALPNRIKSFLVIPSCSNRSSLAQKELWEIRAKGCPQIRNHPIFQRRTVWQFSQRKVAADPGAYKNQCQQLIAMCLWPIVLTKLLIESMNRYPRNKRGLTINGFGGDLKEIEVTFLPKIG